MRMVHALQENITEGAAEVKQTGVGGDAKIVYALLTGMVSDKVVYPVREYATNAWEVSPAGKPFELELPTRFNPQYRIRDFGPGLPHKFMMNRYAKIGESTKDGDDDAVGGWGFGSKAALAYLMRSDGAGSFTVVSRHRGFRRVYTIGVSEQGKIQIQFLGEWVLDADDLGTGLEISFAVRESDISRFHEHAKAVLWSFHPRPKITPAIDFGQPKVLHQGDGCTIYDTQTVPFYGPQVQLGPVMYPVDMDIAPSSEGWVQENDCIVFDGKIGTISVSASREALQYDDRTETGLKALFKHYADDWLTKARIEVDAQPNYFKARWKAAQIASSIGFNRAWHLIGSIGWRGFDFNDSLFPIGDTRAKALCWPEADKRKSDMEIFTFKADWKINPGELESRKIVIQHNTSRSIERMTAAGLLEEPCLWVRTKRADLDYTLNQLGRPEDYIVLDDVKLPKLPKGHREKRPESVKRRKMMLDCNRAASMLVDTDEELLFVKVEGRGRNRSFDTRVDGVSRSFGANRLSEIFRACKEHGLFDQSIEHITILGQYEDPLPHWRHLGDHLAELIDAAIDPTQVRPTIPWNEGSFPRGLMKIRDKRLNVDKAPQELRDVLTDMVNLITSRKTLEAPETVHDQLAALNLKVTGTDLKSVAKDPTQSVRTAWETIIVAFPLLDLLLEKFPSSYYESKFSKGEQAKFDHYFELISR